jgi:hypothetical protein
LINPSILAHFSTPRKIHRPKIPQKSYAEPPIQTQDPTAKFLFEKPIKEKIELNGL